MKKSKLHFEIALFRDLSKSRDSSNSLNCEQPVVWTSYKTAHQETRKYLKRNYVTIKHNVGSLLYTNDNSLKIINSRLDPATKSMSPNDVFALNVRSIRICELQQSTATGLVGCKRSGNGASGGGTHTISQKQKNLESDDTFITSEYEFNDTGNDHSKGNGYLTMSDTTYINLDEVSLVFHFYCPFDSSHLVSNGLQPNAGKEDYNVGGEVGKSNGSLKTENRGQKRKVTSKLIQNVDGLDNKMPLEGFSDNGMDTPIKPSHQRFSNYNVESIGIFSTPTGYGVGQTLADNMSRPQDIPFQAKLRTGFDSSVDNHNKTVGYNDYNLQSSLLGVSTNLWTQPQGGCLGEGSTVEKGGEAVTESKNTAKNLLPGLANIFGDRFQSTTHNRPIQEPWDAAEGYHRQVKRRGLERGRISTTQILATFQPKDLNHSCADDKNGCDLEPQNANSRNMAEASLNNDDLLDPNSANSAATVTCLPCAELDGLWEQLIFDTGIKADLIKYAETVRLFSQSAVSPHVISWHGIILLSGPPGTGKTSLCKALAQKIAIRWCTGGNGFNFGFKSVRNLKNGLQQPEAFKSLFDQRIRQTVEPNGPDTRYTQGFDSCRLIEISCGSLFTKWFGESAKTVSELMTRIHNIVTGNNHRDFVCVLIDEVESLTLSRAGALSSNEPSDYVRVVNTLLTHLDMLKSQPNVLIFCTSNLEPALDDAFRDRIDFSLRVPYPSASSIYTILCSTITELIRTDLVFVESQSESDDEDGLNFDNDSQNTDRSECSVSGEMSQDSTCQGIPTESSTRSGTGIRPEMIIQSTFYASEIWEISKQCCVTEPKNDPGSEHGNKTPSSQEVHSRRSDQDAVAAHTFDETIVCAGPHADLEPAGSRLFSTPARSAGSQANGKGNQQKDRPKYDGTDMPPLVGGRQLRRLALLAFVQHGGRARCTLDSFLSALKMVIEKEKRKRKGWE